MTHTFPWPPASADYRSHKDPAFGELSRKVVEVNLQATPGIVHQRSDSTTQTVWFRRVNSSTQYEPRQGDAVESEQEMRSERMASFLKVRARPFSATACVRAGARR